MCKKHTRDPLKQFVLRALRRDMASRVTREIRRRRSHKATRIHEASDAPGPHPRGQSH